MRLSENKGAMFWLNAFTELQNRGVKNILIACVDRLKGFPDAINAVYTTNAIESLNSVIRKTIKKRKLFQIDTSDKKVIY